MHTPTLELTRNNLHTKFEVPGFIESKDVMRAKKIINGSRDPDHAHLRVVYHSKATILTTIYLYILNYSNTLSSFISNKIMNEDPKRKRGDLVLLGYSRSSIMFDRAHTTSY